MVTLALQRNVPRTLGIYLGASWVFVEFLGWLGDRVVMPADFPVLVTVLLVSLIPSVGITAFFRGEPGRTPLSRVERIGVPTNLAIAVLILAIVSQLREPIEDMGALQRRQVTFRGDIEQAALSPDGQLLATVTSDSVGRDVLSIADLTGDAEHVLVRSSNLGEPRWSPDGLRIAFLSDRIDGIDGETRLLGAFSGRGIYSVSLETSEVDWIGSGAYATWSGDGMRIATAWQDSRFIRVFSVEDGLQATIPISGEFRWVAALDWSPNTGLLATHLVTDGRDVIQTIPLDGAPQARILSDSASIDSPVWGADGRTVLFRRGGQLWGVSVDPATGEARSVPTPRGEFDVPGALSFSASRRRAAYLESSGPSNIWVTELHTAGSSWGEPRALTTGTSRKTYAKVSPDGSRVAYFDLGRGGALFVAHIDQSTPRRLTEGDLESPRGLRWSPDGTRLAFLTGDSPVTVNTLELASGVRQELAPDIPVGGDGPVAWCGSSRLLLDSADLRRFITIDLETGAADATTVSGSYIRARGCSPDGRTVLIRRFGGSWFLLPRQGGDLYSVAESEEFVTWSESLGLIFRDEQRLIRLSPIGEELGALPDLPFNLDEVSFLDLSLDGRIATVLVTEATRDVWLLENIPEGRH